MKNVNGLLNALRVVESACNTDEITIIGHGAVPTAKEMLAKCAHFIEEQYGVSIKLAALVNDEAVCYAKGEVKTYVNNCPCGDCSPCCHEEDEDDTVTDYDLQAIQENVIDYLEDNHGYLASHAIESIAIGVGDIYEDYDGIPVAELENEVIEEKIFDLLENELSPLKDEELSEMTVKICDIGECCRGTV